MRSRLKYVHQPATRQNLAFDYKGSRHQDHLLFCRPGTGATYILEREREREREH
jgi:hypothetical protein